MNYNTFQKFLYYKFEDSVYIYKFHFYDKLLKFSFKLFILRFIYINKYLTKKIN